MKKYWNWSPGALLGILGLAAAWAWTGMCSLARTLKDWVMRPLAVLPAPIDAPPIPPAPTAQSVRPVTDQRPRIEVFTLPRNTFAF